MNRASVLTILLLAVGTPACQGSISASTDADEDARSDGGGDIGDIAIEGGDLGGGDADIGGDAGSDGGGDPGFNPTKPIWPGTTTRFFPGIYFSAGRNPAEGLCTREFNAAFGARGDGWRDEDDGGNKISYLGCHVTINVGRFYRDAALAPHDYQRTCSRSSVAQDPGWSNYYWRVIESILEEPFITDKGGKLFVQIDDTYGNPLPAWMIDQGMAYGRDSAALWRRKTVYALMDLMQAFAARFAADDRIAAFQLTETYQQTSPMPADFTGSEPDCGNIDELTGIGAKRQGRIYQAMALKDAAPDLMVLVMNLVPAMETGYREGSPGMNDLPGQWGAMLNGAQMFVNNCGSGSFSEVDCNEEVHSGFRTMQKYGVTGIHAAAADTQTNEWTIRNSSCCRLGDQNPWGYEVWPAVRGYWPGKGEWKNQPTPAQWLWYYSAEPKNAAADSGLGQNGRDPGGVIPVQYFICRNLPAPVLRASKTDATIVDTRTYANFAEAFDLFGPKGTGAMFSYPAGYR